MTNAENEKQLLRENAANFLKWINDAKQRLSEEEKSKAPQPNRPTKEQSDKAA